MDDSCEERVDSGWVGGWAAGSSEIWVSPSAVETSSRSRAASSISGATEVTLSKELVLCESGDFSECCEGGPDIMQPKSMGDIFPSESIVGYILDWTG